MTAIKIKMVMILSVILSKVNSDLQISLIHKMISYYHKYQKFYSTANKKKKTKKNLHFSINNLIN